MIFKNIVFPINPAVDDVWDEAVDYISEVTETPSSHNENYPKKIADEPIWLKAHNELETIMKKTYQAQVQ